MSSQPILSNLVDTYAKQQPVPLPATTVAALKEICILLDEIECFYRQEGHAPYSPEIPWRVAHVKVCFCLIEKYGGMPDDTIKTLEYHLLDAIGISLSTALELATVRLRHLCRGDDIEHVDTHVLVTVMKTQMRRL